MRITIDNQVAKKLRDLFPDAHSYNQKIRLAVGLDYGPPKKRNWLDTIFHKLCDYK